MAIKTVISIIVGLLIIALVTIAWSQHTRIVEARITARLIAVQRDSAIAKLEILESHDDSLRLITDSLEARRRREAEYAQRRERQLVNRADSLAQAISNMIPEGPSQDSIDAMLGELKTAYETRISDLKVLLITNESEITALQNQVALKESIGNNLREVLALTERERDAWKKAANPGFTVRIKSGIKPFVLGVLGGLAASSIK